MRMTENDVRELILTLQLMVEHLLNYNESKEALMTAGLLQLIVGELIEGTNESMNDLCTHMVKWIVKRREEIKNNPTLQ